MNMHRWKPNVTVAAVIDRIFADGDRRFLLVEELTRDGLKLNNPAGHLEIGESPEDACRREVQEETAFAFAPAALVGIYLARFAQQAVASTEDSAAAASPPSDITSVRFAFCGDLGAFAEGQPLDRGIVRTVWMTLDEIRASRSRHRTSMLLRCVEDFIAGQRMPLSLVHTDASVYAGPDQAIAEQGGAGGDIGGVDAASHCPA